MMLSDVELNEHLRALSIGQRLQYSTAVAVMMVVTFVVSLSAAILVGLVITRLIVGSLVLPDDMIVLSLPIITGFLLVLGLGAMAQGDGVPAGQKLSLTSRKALRRGFISGFAAGIGFGLLWALITRGDALVDAGLLAAAIGVAHGIFHGLASIVEPLCLGFVARPAK